MKYILFLSLTLFTGCMSAHKATSYLQKKGALAEVCAENFPITERVIEGETIVQTDTILVPGDSVQCAPSPVPKKVKCPDAKIEVRHSFRVDTLVQENTAKVEMYKTKYLEERVAREATQKELADMKASRDEWRTRCIGILICIGAILVVIGFFKFYLLR